MGEKSVPENWALPGRADRVSHQFKLVANRESAEAD
jgi:hypothetical protein